MRKFSMFLTLFVLVLTIPACGDNKSQLTGQVSLNGEILEFGQVSAFNSKGEIISSGLITKGEYRLEDLPPGDVVLLVNTVGPTGNPIGVRDLPLQPKEGPAPPPDVKKSMLKDLTEAEQQAMNSFKHVPLKYTRPAESDLKVSVKPGLQKYDIAMKGKGEKPPTPPAK